MTTKDKYIQKLEELVVHFNSHYNHVGFRFEEDGENWFNGWYVKKIKLESELSELKAEIEQPEPVPVRAEEILHEKHKGSEEWKSWLIIEAMEEYASQFQSKPTDEEIRTFIKTIILDNPKFKSPQYTQGAMAGFFEGAKAQRDGKIKRVGDKQQ